jgi:hypothetical protein
MSEQKQTKYTKGPWTVTPIRLMPAAPIQGFSIRAEGRRQAVVTSGTCGSNEVLIIDDPQLLASGGFEGFYTTDEVVANGNLIVAAPALLDALEGAVTLLELLRTGNNRKGKEVKYAYVEARDKSMVKVEDAITEFQRLIAKAKGAA